MSSVHHSALEERVLLLAPTRRDAQTTQAFLATANLVCVPCNSLPDLCNEIRAGCGAVLLTEAILLAPDITELIAELEKQPAWADLPLVMLMRDGTQSRASARALELLRNVTVLERPAPARSVISALQAAVRARKRQYQAREQIQTILRAEARYRELRGQLEIAVEASELGTFHFDVPTGKLVWNDRCKAHFWLPPSAQIDIDLFYSILHPDDRERTRRAVDDCVYRGALCDIEYRTVSPRGEIRWVRATGRTFRDEKGEPIHFDGTTQDITQKRKAAEDREQLLRSEQAARAESDRAGRMKDEFLATLSHELRTPLNAILGWSQLIRRTDDKETLREGLEVIERNTKAQVQLIEDLLDMSRIISGKIRLDVGPIDPMTFINAAIETVMPSAKARQIELHTIDETREALVVGDGGRLQQVIWNLLSNAIKFTGSGGSVVVRVRRLQSSVEISVSDTGKGIDAEFLPYVFDRFRQADASATRMHGGLGLGLAIVKQLVELHGGTISVASAGANRGSTFTLLLPVASEDRQIPDASLDHGPRSRRTTPQGEDAMLKGVKVLVVDDEPDGRSLVKRLLEESGAIVADAGSAAEAIGILPALKPDVLVSDIGMPHVDGYELLRRVRALGKPFGGDVPAIALTAFARAEDQTRALRAGYAIHMAKPVEPRELIATVATVGRRGN